MANDAQTGSTIELLDVVQSDSQLAAETVRAYDMRRQLRRPYEVQWYLNASALRGFPDVRWNADLARLEIKREPSHRKRFRINHIKPKYVARVAKYTRIPPNPTVIPATTDREDIFNARASQKALEYYTRKASLRAKWVQVMQWVPLTGKAFWSIRWNDDAISHAPTKLDSKLAPITGEVEVEYCSAFEILPADPGIELMAHQPEILRVRLLPCRDIERRYNRPLGSIAPESGDIDLFFYQRQIADLGTRQQGMASRSALSDDSTLPTHALCIERFIAPNATYPHGRYLVVASNELLHKQDSLPGTFSHLTRNPYPFIEFCDDAAPGQFWPDAFVERMIGLQSEYNEYRSKMGENLAMHFFPKLVVPKQLNLSEEAYTSEAGERLNVNWIPGIPMPMFLQPASVIGDAWNILQTIRKEMDDITLIYPAAMGGVGGASSGFQTSLLQEAADQVHGPTIQRNAIALEEAYVKIRHLMKQFYTIPRMVSIAGRSNIPEIYEFSQDTVDENAEIRIEPDTMMPQLRSARIDQIRQMYTEGLFGPPPDPKTQRRVQDMLRMSFADFEIERDQRDQEQAQLENITMLENGELQKPQPWENHQLHWEAHVDLFKSPEARQWSTQTRAIYVFHALVHLCYINPEDAKLMSREYGLEPAIQEILAAILPPPAPAAPPPVETQEPPLSTQPAPLVINNEVRLPTPWTIKRNPETGLIEGIVPEGETT
jgi:hypothetical protein